MTSLGHNELHYDNNDLFELISNFVNSNIQNYSKGLKEMGVFFLNTKVHVELKLKFVSKKYKNRHLILS